MVEDKNEPYRRMRVFGRVQRVLFRDSARRKAAALGLKGYVRNLEDGSMELIANGPPEGIEKLFEWAKRGPLFARVDRYELDTISLSENFSDFTIHY